MPIIRNMTDAQVIERINNMIGYVDNWSKGELTVRGKDGALDIELEVKTSGKKNSEELSRLGGLLQEFKNMIARRECYLFTNEDLPEASNE